MNTLQQSIQASQLKTLKETSLTGASASPRGNFLAASSGLGDGPITCAHWWA